MTQQTVSSQIPSAALLLGLAGLIPFAAGAASQWVALPLLTPEPGLKLIIAYGAIILSFLGGIRWGTAIGPYDTRRQGLEFSASVMGSLAGLAAIFIPTVPALTLLIAGFLMQALWDVTSVEAGRLPGWFGKLRMLLTAGAVVSLIAALVAVLVI
jgi:hypothetical protein